MNLVLESGAIARDWASQDQAARQAEIKSQWRELLTILLRDEPEQDDSDQLARCRMELSYFKEDTTDEALQELLRDYRRAVKQEAILARDEEIRAARIKASEAYRAMQKQHEAEEHEVFMARGSSENQMRLLSAAPHELTHIVRRHPILFDDSESPPKLLKPELRSPPVEAKPAAKAAARPAKGKQKAPAAN